MISLSFLKSLDLVQVRRIAMGVVGGFVIGGLVTTYCFPTVKDKIVTQVETKVQTVTQEVVKWKTQTVTVTKIQKVYVKSKQAKKLVEYYPNGQIKLSLDQSNSTSTDTSLQSGSVSQEKSQEMAQSKTVESDTKTTVTTEGTTRGGMRFSLGVTTKVMIPYKPSIKDFGLMGGLQLGPIQGTVGWNFNNEVTAGLMYQF